MAVFLSLSFLLPVLSWAFDPATFSVGQAGVTFQNKLVDIPTSFGTVHNAWQGGQRLVVHIQDLHCNYEVQMNIARILGRLANQHGLKLVAVEGASLPVNLTKLTTFPLADVRQEVADYFVRRGQLSGAEFFAATTQHPVRIEGIEDPALYARNHKSVERLLSNEVLGTLQDLRSLLDAVKPAVYGPDLLKAEQHAQAYREGRVSLLQHGQWLARIARRLSLDLGRYPQLAAYLANRQAWFPPQVDADQLYAEIEALDRLVRERLASRGPEHELNALQHRLDQIEKMLNISAGPEDLAEFYRHREAYRIWHWLAFIQQHDPRLGSQATPELMGLDDSINAAEDFYRVADARSLAFARNLAARMDEQHAGLAALVTGGFHTKQVFAALKAQGFSILSLKPSLTQQDLVNPYFNLLQNRQSPLEKLLSQNQRVLTNAPYLPQTPDPNQIIQETTDLGPRERGVARLLDLLLKLKTLAKFYFQKKIGQELERQVLQAFGHYRAQSPEIRVQTGAITVHARNTLSVQVTAPDAQDLLAVVWPQQQQARFKDAAILEQATFRTDQVALIDRPHQARVQAQLDEAPPRSLADLKLRELVAIYLAWRLVSAGARRWAQVREKFDHYQQRPQADQHTYTEVTDPGESATAAQTSHKLVRNDFLKVSVVRVFRWSLTIAATVAGLGFFWLPEASLSLISVWGALSGFSVFFIHLPRLGYFYQLATHSYSMDEYLAQHRLGHLLQDVENRFRKNGHLPEKYIRPRIQWLQPDPEESVPWLQGVVFVQVEPGMFWLHPACQAWPEWMQHALVTYGLLRATGQSRWRATRLEYQQWFTVSRDYLIAAVKITWLKFLVRRARLANREEYEHLVKNFYRKYSIDDPLGQARVAYALVQLYLAYQKRPIDRGGFFKHIRRLEWRSADRLSTANQDFRFVIKTIMETAGFFHRRGEEVVDVVASFSSIASGVAPEYLSQLIAVQAELLKKVPTFVEMRIHGSEFIKLIGMLAGLFHPTQRKPMLEQFRLMIQNADHLQSREAYAEVKSLFGFLRATHPAFRLISLNFFALLSASRRSVPADLYAQSIIHLQEKITAIMHANQEIVGGLIALVIALKKAKNNLTGKNRDQGPLEALDEILKQFHEHGEDTYLTLLKSEADYSEIAVRDGAGLTLRYGVFLHLLYDYLPAMHLPLPRGVSPIPNEISVEALPEMTLEQLMEKAGLSGPLKLLRQPFGRSLIFQAQDGKLLVIKRAKKDESNAVLQGECLGFNWARKHRQEQGVPKPVDLGGEEYRFRFPLTRAMDAQTALDIQTVLKKAQQEALEVGKPFQLAPSDTAIAYVLPANSLYTQNFRSVNVKTWHDLTQALRRVSWTLGRWARQGVVHTTLGDMFHNLADGGEREYIFTKGLDDVLGHSVGRLTAWQSATFALNFSPAGEVRDYKFVRYLSQVMGNEKYHQGDWAFVWQQFAQREINVFLLEFMSRYNLIYTLAVGNWLDEKKWQGLDWSKPATLVELSNLMLDTFTQTALSFAGRKKKTMIHKLAALVDWDRYAAQMAFFMNPSASNGFLRPPTIKAEPDTRQERFPAQRLFGLKNNQVIFGDLRPGSWDDTEGMVGSLAEPEAVRDKRAIGNVNGSTFLLENVKASYLIFGLLIADRALEAYGSDSWHRRLGHWLQDVMAGLRLQWQDGQLQVAPARIARWVALAGTAGFMAVALLRPEASVWVAPVFGLLAGLVVSAMYAPRLYYLYRLWANPPPDEKWARVQNRVSAALQKAEQQLGQRSALPDHYQSPRIEFTGSLPKGWRILLQGLTLGQGSPGRMILHPQIGRLPDWALQAVVTHELQESLGHGHGRATWAEYGSIIRSWAMSVWRFRIMPGVPGTTAIAKPRGIFSFIVVLTKFTARLWKPGRALTPKELFTASALITIPLVETVIILFLFGPKLLLGFNALPLDPRWTWPAAMLLTNGIFALLHGFSAFEVRRGAETRAVQVIPVTYPAWKPRVLNWARFYLLGLIFYGEYYLAVVLKAFSVNPRADRVALAILLLGVLAAPVLQYYFHRSVLRQPEKFPHWLRVLGMAGAGSLTAQDQTATRAAWDSQQITDWVSTYRSRNQPDWQALHTASENTRRRVFLQCALKAPKRVTREYYRFQLQEFNPQEQIRNIQFKDDNTLQQAFEHLSTMAIRKPAQRISTFLEINQPMARFESGYLYLKSLTDSLAESPSSPEQLIRILISDDMRFSFTPVLRGYIEKLEPDYVKKHTPAVLAVVCALIIQQMHDEISVVHSGLVKGLETWTGDDAPALQAALKKIAQLKETYSPERILFLPEESIPTGHVSRENADEKNHPESAALRVFRKNRLQLHSYLLIKIGLASGNVVERECAANSLGFLAHGCLAANPGGHWLETIAWPHFNTALQDPESTVRAAAAQGLGGLVQACMSADPSGRLLQRLAVPLFETALRDPAPEVRIAAAKNLEKLAEICGAGESGRELIMDVFQPLCASAIGDKDINVVRTAKGSLGSLVLASQRVDPTGVLLKQVYVPFFEQALKIGDNGTDESLDLVAQACGSAQHGPWLFQHVYRPLFRSAVLAGSKMAGPSLGTLAQASIKADPSGNLLTVWYDELYEFAMQVGTDKVKDSVAGSLGGLALACVSLDSSGRLLKQKCGNYYTRSFGNRSSSVKAGAAGSLGLLAQACRQVDMAENQSMLQDWFLSIHQKVISIFDPKVHHRLVQNFPIWAQVSLEADPSGQLWKKLSSPVLEFVLRSVGYGVGSVNSIDSEIHEVLVRTCLKIDTSGQLLKKIYKPFFKTLIMDGSDTTKSNATKSLGFLVAECLHVDPSGVLLETIYPELYAMTCWSDRDDGEDWLNAEQSLGPLAQASLQADPSGELLKKFYVPRYQTALAAGVWSAADSLGVLAHSCLKADPAGKLLREIYLPLFRETMKHQDESMHNGAGQSLMMLAPACAAADSSGALVREVYFPLFTLARKDWSDNARRAALLSLGPLVATFWDHELELIPLEDSVRRLQAIQTENPQADVSEEEMLISLYALYDGYPAKLNNPTAFWVYTLRLFSRIKSRFFGGGENDLYRVSLMDGFLGIADALARKGARIDRQALSQAYQRYFSVPQTVRGTPKDWIAHMLLDWSLQLRALPGALGGPMRQKKKPANFKEQLPLLRAILQGTKDVILVAQALGEWANDVPPNELSVYWDKVGKILLFIAREKIALMHLDLWREVQKMLEVADLPESAVTQAKGKINYLQQQQDQLENLIPNKVQAVFHFTRADSHWVQPDQKERNLIAYVARHEYAQEDHPVNRLLRGYFKSRLSGKDVKIATTQYEAAVKSEESLAGLLTSLKGYLDSTQSRLKAPAKLAGRVFLSGMDVGRQQMLIQWDDALRHLGEWVREAPEETEAIAHLRAWLAKIDRNKSPKDAEIKGYVAQLKAILDKIPGEGNTRANILTHLANVEKGLQESGAIEDAALTSHAGSVEVIVEAAASPVDIVHLGWPDLGGSCLDCVDGHYQQYAAGYLRPDIRVVYVWNKKNYGQPNARPLARLSVALDPAAKVLYRLGIIKTSSPYHFEPLMQVFEKKWAALFTSNAHPGSAKVHLPAGPADFYSDTTETILSGGRGWTGSVSGWILDGQSGPVEDRAPGHQDEPATQTPGQGPAAEARGGTQTPGPGLPDRVVNRSLFGLQTPFLRIVRFIFEPNLQFKPWFKSFGFMAGGVRFLLLAAFFIYLSLAPVQAAQTTGPGAYWQQQALLLPDAVSGRQFHVAQVRFDDVSARGSLGQRLIRGELFGSHALEQGRLKIYLPSALVGQSGAGGIRQALYEVAVWSQALQAHQDRLSPFEPWALRRRAAPGVGLLRPAGVYPKILQFLGIVPDNRWQPGRRRRAPRRLDSAA